MKRRLQIEVVRYRRITTFEDDGTNLIEGLATLFDPSFNDITNEEPNQSEDHVIEPKKGISTTTPLSRPRQSLTKLLRSKLNRP